MPSRIPSVLLPSLLVLATCASVLGSTFAQSSPGAPAPAITGQTPAAGALQLPSFAGKVVVVDFWASWCEPCRASFPVLEAMHRRLSSRGVVFVGVSEDREASNMAAFLRRNPVSYTQVHDVGGQTARRFRPPRMPTMYVIDKTGVVRHIHAGWRNGDGTELERKIETLLR